jgi:potassium-transporting ATPase KdpC subunit
MVRDMLTSLRFAWGTLLLCAVIYPVVLLGVGTAIVPSRAAGNLIRDPGGTLVGSRFIAQGFTRDEYLWPRPSAVGYDAAAAGGSNLSASNPALAQRAETSVARLTATANRPAPGELVAASGSGLDPHITLDGALYQASRIAGARGVSAERVEEVLRHEASSSTPWSSQLVNVLETNLALDRNLGSPPPR